MTTKSFKIGIIGAGVIADFHAQAIRAMEGAELVAAFARKDEKAQSFAQKYQCAGYSDMDAFLNHPEMEVVTICSVSGAHLEHATLFVRNH